MQTLAVLADVRGDEMSALAAQIDANATVAFGIPPRERPSSKEVARSALPCGRQHPRCDNPPCGARRRRCRARNRSRPWGSTQVLAARCAHVHAVEAASTYAGAAAPEPGRASERIAPLGRCPSARPRSSSAGADEAGREPAVQRRDPDRRREPRPAPHDRQLVRDGPTRSRRPLLRGAVDEGLRCGFGAGPARDASHRVSPGLAHGLPAPAERRLRTRRLPSRPLAERLRRHPPGRQGAFAHRRKTLANSLQLAGVSTRHEAVSALVDLGLDPAVRAEALEPPLFVGLTRRIG